MKELRLQDLQRFLLYKQGLSGKYRFYGKEVAMDYIRQAGCIQYDPVDVCGRNAELTLQSRIKGITKKDLYELLYEERRLFDYTDKQMSIIPIENWPYLARWRDSAKKNTEGFPHMRPLLEQTVEYIRENGPVSSKDLPIEGTVRWNSAIHWSGDWHNETNAARSALEQLYSEGRLVIHHKSGTIKYYDLAERHIPKEILNAPDPHEYVIDYIKWCISRRTGATGIIKNKRSDVLFGIWGIDPERRKLAFKELEEDGTLTVVKILETGHVYYMLTTDIPLLEQASQTDNSKRCELIAPLDPLMWDRDIIEDIFSFKYRWEIYTPASKRQYGYYVLPVIYNGRFAGRTEAVNNRNDSVLEIKGLWLEPGFRETKAFREALDSAYRRLARFNNCNSFRILY